MRVRGTDHIDVAPPKGAAEVTLPSGFRLIDIPKPIHEHRGLGLPVYPGTPKGTRIACNECNLILVALEWYEGSQSGLYWKPTNIYEEQR